MRDVISEITRASKYDLNTHLLPYICRAPGAPRVEGTSHADLAVACNTLMSTHAVHSATAIITRLGNFTSALIASSYPLGADGGALIRNKSAESRTIVRFQTIYCWTYCIYSDISRLAPNIVVSVSNKLWNILSEISLPSRVLYCTWFKQIVEHIVFQNKCKTAVY